MRDLIEAGLNEPRVAGSGYGDCVAAPIRHGERAPWVDGGEAMAACVRAGPQGGNGSVLSMAGSVGAEDSVLSGLPCTAWRLTPGGDIAAAATRPSPLRQRPTAMIATASGCNRG